MCTAILWKAVWTMCLVLAIRAACKQALQSGRVYQQWLLHDAAPKHLVSVEPALTDFSELVKPLTEQQWSAFQVQERDFRSSLVTEKHHEKQHYVSSADTGSWIRLFTLERHIFQEWCVYN